MTARPAAGNRWGFPEALGGFAAGLVLASVAASLAGSATGFRAGPGRPLPVDVIVADLAGLWVGLVGAALVASGRHGSSRLSLRGLDRDFGLRIAGWRDLVGGAAVGLACQYVLIPLVYLPFEGIDPSLRRQLGRPAHTDTAAAHGLGPVLALVVVLVVGAPLVEELFFRGLVLRSLLARTPAPVAIVVSAVLFGLAHFEAVQFAGLALFGAVLGALAWRTGRLAPSMAAHAAFNAAAVAAVVHLH